MLTIMQEKSLIDTQGPLGFVLQSLFCILRKILKFIEMGIINSLDKTHVLT